MKNDEDLVQSTFSELVLFLLFSALILLGSQSYLGVSDNNGNNVIDSNGKSKQHQINKLVRGATIITLSDNAGYRFAFSRSDLNSQFAGMLMNHGIVEVEKLLAKYAGLIEAIEVIGHTDEMPHNRNHVSNLDQNLAEFLAGGNIVSSDLKAGDNAGLAMARAAAVADFIARNSRAARKYPILPYSGAQVILPAQKLASPNPNPAPDPNRRRIEVRLRFKQTSG